MVLGVIGLVGVVASLFIAGETGVQVMGVSVFANIVFLPLFGWKVYRLSRATKKS